MQSERLVVYISNIDQVEEGGLCQVGIVSELSTQLASDR